jgi:O-antigen/teichoic acid export membrane protein
MMVLNNAIDVGTTAAQQAGIFLLILAGAGVYIVAAWISASVVLGIIAYVVASARLVGWSALRPAFSVEVVRRTIGFTGNMMVISVLSLVQSQAAQVIVSKLLPIAEFGFYGFAASTVNRATFVTNAVAQAAFPSFSSLFAANDRPGLLLQYRKLQDLVCYGTLPIFTGIIFAAVPVYTYVFNAGVAQRLLLPTAFLALGTWMNATISIPYMLSVAMGKQQIAMRTTVLAIVFVLPVTVLLIYRFGLNGAGLSWVYYHVFAYAYMVPRICRECLGIRPTAWFQHAAKAFGIGVAAYGLAWVVLVQPNEASLPIVVVAYVIATLVFAPIGLLLIGPDLRFTLRQFRASLSKP